MSEALILTRQIRWGGDWQVVVNGIVIYEHKSRVIVETIADNLQRALRPVQS